MSFQDNVNAVVEAIEDSNGAFSTVQEIADEVGLWKTQVDHIIGHVRSHCLEYGFTIPNVQKGSIGQERRYQVVGVDGDGNLITDVDHAALKYGLVSTTRGLGSMSLTTAGSLAMVVPASDQFNAKLYRKLTTGYTSEVEMTSKQVGILERALPDD